MSNVVSFSGTAIHEPAAPNEGLIRCLSELMELAKAGTLQSFIGTGFSPENDRVTIWCDCHPNVYETLGSLGWLQDEYLARHRNR